MSFGMSLALNNRRNRGRSVAVQLAALGADSYYTASAVSAAGMPCQIGSGRVLQFGTTAGVDAADPTTGTGADGPFVTLAGASTRLQLEAGESPAITASTGKHSALIVVSIDADGAYKRLLSFESSTNVGPWVGSGNTQGSVYLWSNGATGSRSKAISAGTKVAYVMVWDEGTARIWRSGISGFSSAAIGTLGTVGTGAIGSFGHSLGGGLASKFFSYAGFPGVALTEAQAGEAATLAGVA